MSGKMAAIVGHDYVFPRLTSLSVTSDGYLVAFARDRNHENLFLGAFEDLQIRVAGLTKDEE